jgi:site-specific recombinase XerD
MPSHRGDSIGNELLDQRIFAIYRISKATRKPVERPILAPASMLTGLHELWRNRGRESEASPFIFVSERGAPFSVAGFQKLIAGAGEKAGFEFPVHPHMLRHACGYALANAGQDTRALQAYLGHRCIQHTTIYTELSPERFKSFWKD